MGFTGMFLDSMWLIVVDAYSKLPEVVEMTSISTARIVLEPQTILPDRAYQKYL